MSVIAFYVHRFHRSFGNLQRIISRSMSGPKRSNNIWHMLRNQGTSPVKCPACNAQVPKLKLDWHLDVQCSSAPSKGGKSDTDSSIEKKMDADPSIEKKSDTDPSIEGKSDADPSSVNLDSFADDIDVSKIKSLKPNRTFRTARWSPNVYNLKRKSPSGKTSPTKDSRENSDEGTVTDGMMLKRSKPESSLDNQMEDKIDSVDFSADSGVFDSPTDSVFNSDSPSIPDSEGTDAQKVPEYSPYYIANFKEIIFSVLDDENNKHLFNQDDLNCVNKFNSLSDPAQKLYVRLFQRKYKWLRPMRIVYPQIAKDLKPYLEELMTEGFLESGAACIDLETALDLLTLNETKNLTKQFNLNGIGKSKHEISQLLIKHGKQHKSFFSQNGDSSVTLAILKKVKQIMGPCYRLALEQKRLFTRILMLFSLPTISEDDEEAAGGQQQQLFTFLQVKKGELKFPAYKMTRKYKIFSDRDELIRYETARQLENDILNTIESKKFDSAKEQYLKAKEEFIRLRDSGVVKKDSEMPFFLRRYTARHVYVRCLNQGVEVLQRLRSYQEAVEQISELLDQTVYCQDRRGKWYDRLALNLDQHLKQPEKAAEAIKTGLRDSYVRVGPRFSLLTRAERIALSKNCEDDELKACLAEMAAVKEAPKVTVHGRLLPRPIPGRRHIFISSYLDPSKTEPDVTVVSVEQLAIDHYNSIGYTQGLHGEGSTFVSLYALLFWDIIYDGNIPDVFISPYQTHPLDLNSDDFYQSRQQSIVNHLETIKNANEQELKDMINFSWEANHGAVSLVSWDLFADVEHVQGLVSCLGNQILSGICERIAKDFRFTRSGVPDLVVWNPDTKKVKIVEVKGPGDKLSTKQILWLDYLLRLGADAEVCLVEAVGSKKLKK